MRVLVLGANGFIGRHLTAALLSAGHKVVAAVRRPDEIRRRFPGIHTVKADLNQDIAPDIWMHRLEGIDAVVNAAGILRATPGQSLDAVHIEGPLALYEACQAQGVRRIIHISATGADTGAGTGFATSKHEAEERLKAFDLDWMVLRPSLVYAQGSYGGTSLMRGLSALPFVIPLPGKGDQPFQPLHADDLAQVVISLLESRQINRCTLEPCGPERLFLKDILIRWRAWLGLPEATILSIPLPMLRLACKMGDVLGRGPFSTTALNQLLYGNAADPEAFSKATGMQFDSLDRWLARSPSHVQDRWHARLYFIKPLLRAVLAFLWLGSGLMGLFLPPGSWSEIPVSPFLARLAGGVDLVFAASLILGQGLRWSLPLQALVIAGYTAILSFLVPGLWLEPLGPLLKNLPALAAVLVLMAMEDER
ncbi:MAG: NAD(P)H-binding protein [Alphaproteobacteria bacterium]|nr:NAD(P)H-binding protein [Alphaproteobacteria bacterium]